MIEKIEKFVEKLWRAFSSMKTGLVLLGIIAVASGIGTLIPQQPVDPEGAQAAAQIWRTLQFTDVYSAPWFLFLFGLLCVNLLVCSIQRFRGIYKITFRPEPPQEITQIPRKMQSVITGQGDVDVQSKTTEILKSKGFRLTQLEKDGSWSFTAHKRGMGNFGSFITHVSFVILTLGVLIGALSGFKGYLVAGEGDVIPIRDINVSKGQVKEDFSVRIDSTEDRIMENGERDNWYTDLSILESGSVVESGTISVNHPLTYRGVTFYQSGYAMGASFTITMDGETYTAALQGGNFFNVPGTEVYFVLSGIRRNLQESVIAYQVYDTIYQVDMGEMAPGQSVMVQDTFTVTFDDFTGFTGLQVKADPGVSVVMTGCGLLMIGLLLSFYWRPVRLSGLLCLHPQAVLTVGAYSGRLDAGIQAEFNQIVDAIKNTNACLTERGDGIE